ncbi:MAG TPA: GGDEF domain-containing protein [Candidatus Limnocylindrales bacterium]|nr:GGDEF domain-containing protein [Candidatus Limnocylindrales bacterium]
MPAPLSLAPDPFIAAARALARGGPLGARLDALARQAAALAGGPSAIVYLLDGEQGTLLPGGSAGLGDGGLAALATLSLDAEGETAGSDPLSQAVRVRRPAVVAGDAAVGTTLGGGRPLAAVATLPLVTEDEAGAQAVQGLLAVGLDAAPADPSALLDRLGALADLAATAVHQGRLEQALDERSEWLERVAHLDPLTGLTNRRTFQRLLEHELVRAARQDTAVSLALFDVDDLAGIDTEFGSDAADQVLRTVAVTLADKVRLVDTVARVGGDEFALLAPGSAGRVIADRVTAAMASFEPVSGQARLARAVSLSAGVARFPEDGATSTELLEAAETALRQAKDSGPGTVVEAAGGPARA